MISDIGRICRPATSSSIKDRAHPRQSSRHYLDRITGMANVGYFNIGEYLRRFGAESRYAANSRVEYGARFGW